MPLQLILHDNEDIIGFTVLHARGVLSNRVSGLRSREPAAHHRKLTTGRKNDPSDYLFRRAPWALIIGEEPLSMEDRPGYSQMSKEQAPAELLS